MADEPHISYADPSSHSINSNLGVAGAMTVAVTVPPKMGCPKHGEVQTSTLSLWQAGRELRRTPPICPHCYFEIQLDLFRGAFLVDAPAPISESTGALVIG